MQRNPEEGDWPQIFAEWKKNLCSLRPLLGLRRQAFKAGVPGQRWRQMRFRSQSL